MTEDKAKSLYAEDVSPRALARQQREAEARFPCCGERRIDGHHPLCENFIEPLPSIRQDALF